jgi:2,5-diketo-D-gluconate reductase A
VIYRIDYVDLFLIHWPLPTRYGGDFVSTWKVLEEFAKELRARSIGVSNFQVSHLGRLAQESDMIPAVNQAEIHPYFANEEVRAYGKAHDIAIQAWSPIADMAAISTLNRGESGRIGPHPNQFDIVT